MTYLLSTIAQIQLRRYTAEAAITALLECDDDGNNAAGAATACAVRGGGGGSGGAW
jgi:hypothetical protein